MKQYWCLALACVVGLHEISHAVEPAMAQAPVQSKPVDYIIVVTGGELLEGVYPDAHTPFLTRTLRPLGCRCVGSLTVDDERMDIQQALRFATNKAALVIVTGGLGPTPNDITRETLSEFTGIPLREDSDVLADMEKRFNESRDKLRPNLRKQTLVPTRGSYLKNSAGTAVGLIYDAGAAVIVALPGPPRELQPMVRNEVVPFLRRRFGVRDFGCSLTLRFVGAGQSLIDQTIKDHVAVAPDVTITSLFEASRVDFTFSLPGNSAGDKARLKRLEESIREHLAQYIYADDGSSLEEVVVRKLVAQGDSLAIAEIGSGGQLAAALHGTIGLERLLAGAYVAPSDSAMNLLLRMPLKESDNAGEERAKAIANAAIRMGQSKAGLAIGAPESGRDGVKTLCVVLQRAKGPTVAHRLTLRDSGEIHRSNLVTQILDWLRKVDLSPAP